MGSYSKLGEIGLSSLQCTHGRATLVEIAQGKTTSVASRNECKRSSAKARESAVEQDRLRAQRGVSISQFNL
jgi:hypothetical protein